MESNKANENEIIDIEDLEELEAAVGAIEFTREREISTKDVLDMDPKLKRKWIRGIRFAKERGATLEAFLHEHMVNTNVLEEYIKIIWDMV